MQFCFNNIAIIGTHHNPCVADTVTDLHHLLKDHFTLFIEKETAQSLPYEVHKHYDIEQIAKTCDIAIVVGGDGNFLNAGRSLSLLKEIPIVGINRGKLGFLTEIAPSELNSRLMDILKGQYQQEKRFMLQAYIDHSQPSPPFIALNDIVVASGQHSRLFQMHVHIDGRYAFDQRADGMIIATPTGSTAHALSAGGPIMHPSVNAIVLVPMFSHSLNSRPIVIGAQSIVEITIGDYNDPRPSLSLDGHMRHTLTPGMSLKISRYDKYVKILHPKDYDYFHSLRTKLHWGKMLFP